MTYNPEDHEPDGGDTVWALLCLLALIGFLWFIGLVCAAVTPDPPPARVEHMPAPKVLTVHGRELDRATRTRTRPPALHLSALERAIAGCESAGRPDAPIDWQAKNPTSTASGGFQFLDTSWTYYTHLAPPARAWPPATQLAAFRAAYKISGTQPWAASATCWKGTTP